jgi:hypothetical protein
MAGHPTPEAAALAEADHRSPYAVGVTVHPAGEDAYVLLGQDRPPCDYWGDEFSLRRYGGWWEVSFSMSFGSGGVFGRADPEDESRGLVGLALPAPPGAAAAVVRYRGRDHRVAAVPPGWIFFAAWDHPYPSPSRWPDLPPGARIERHDRHVSAAAEEEQWVVELPPGAPAIDPVRETFGAIEPAPHLVRFES